MNYETNKANEDYAAEFRSDLVKLNTQRNDQVFAGVNQSGRPELASVPEALQKNEWVTEIKNAVAVKNITSTQASFLRRVIEHILTILSEKPDVNMFTFGGSFLEQLKKAETSEDVIYRFNAMARTLFLEIAETTTDYQKKVIIREMAGKGNRGSNQRYGNWPKLSEPKKKPRKSLACTYGEIFNATNEQFLLAFTEFNLAFISEWNLLRQQLRNDHSDLYKDIVDFIKRVGVEHLDYLQTLGNIITTRSEISDENREDYEELITLSTRVLIALDRPILTCSAYAAMAGQKHMPALVKEKGWSKFELNSFREVFVQDGTLKSIVALSRQDNGSTRAVEPTLFCDLKDFVQMSDEEKMCMSWLFATYRLPPSAINKIALSDVGTNDRNYFVRAYKSRNKKSENPSFPINSPQGRTLTTYLKSVGISPLGNRDKNDHLICERILRNRYSLANTPNFSFVELLAVANASDENFRKVCKEDVGLTSMSDDSFNLVRDTFEHIRGLPSGKKTSLVPTMFSQAHVYAEEAKRGDFKKSKTMSDITYGEEDPVLADINARKNFHTLKTRNTVYRARSRDKLILKMGDDLGLAVNAEMQNIVGEILATKLDPENGTARVLTHDEYRTAIGILDNKMDASPEALRLAAQAQHFIVEESGIIQKDGQIIVLDDAMTAFLMSEKMRHIEDAAGDNFTNFGNFGRQQIIAIWSEYMLLDELHERLSPESKLAANQPPYSNLRGKFKFSPLVAGGFL